MKQSIVFETSFDSEHLAFDYHGELEQFEVRALKHLQGALAVSFDEVQLPLELWNDKKIKFASDKLSTGITLKAGAKVSLSEGFPFRHFVVQDIRKAYILARRICAQVQEAMILSLPHAPFYGLHQDFDFRVDMPKEVGGFEAFRRSIIVRSR